jgi:hypothetical protein
VSAPRPACGTYNGYAAHKRRGEPACPDCKAGAAAYEATRRTARQQAKARGETIPGPGRPPRENDHFIPEVEHLAYAGEGWGTICTRFALTPAALERRLMRHGRHDLAQTIFGTERYNITQGRKAAA